jgi:6-pyruvoyltetrahydropterin/6-carboxytetrahydropterin synthase
LIDKHVIEKLDHRNINLEVDFMAAKLASTENLAIGIWNELRIPIAAIGAALHSIKVYETENNFVEYLGS